MLQNIACLLTVSLGLLVSVSAENITTRIVGGIETTIDKCPFLVQVLPASYLCGGSLVKLNFVVTAAHCFQGIIANQVQVRAGTGRLFEHGQVRDVAKIIRHEDFNPNTMAFDVTVLKLVKPFETGPYIKTIPLFAGPVVAGMKTNVYGWGTTSSGGTSSNQVRSVTVPVINHKKCEENYKGQAVLTKTMYCASVRGEKDSCQGDSGGPATYNGQLIGIVSWGIGCATNKYPGVYTSVPIITNFIERSLKK